MEEQLLIDIIPRIVKHLDYHTMRNFMRLNKYYYGGGNIFLQNTIYSIVSQYICDEILNNSPDVYLGQNIRCIIENSRICFHFIPISRSTLYDLHDKFATYSGIRGIFRVDYYPYYTELYSLSYELIDKLHSFDLADGKIHTMDDIHKHISLQVVKNICHQIYVQYGRNIEMAD